MEKIDINRVKKLIKEGNIRWTNHILVRLFRRNISRQDVLEVLLNGEILEEKNSEQNQENKQRFRNQGNSFKRERR